MWNQPSGYTNGLLPSAGNMATGPVGNPAHYAPLLDAGSVWTPDGDANGTNHQPDYYLQLSSIGGHPGGPAGTPGANTHDRYAIAAYQVSVAGSYTLTNSSLTKPSTLGDAIEIIVHINGNAPLVSGSVAPGGTGSFNTSLGTLNAGDVIYVAVGAGGTFDFDAFHLDFSITRPAPPLTMTNPVRRVNP